MNTVMDLDQLKQGWQNAGKEENLAQKQLEMMTKISQHPVLSKIRRKLIIEAVAITVLLFVFYDIFDGHNKPAYASVVLVLGVVFYLGSNVYSFFTLQKPVSSDNVLVSLQQFLVQLQRAKVFSLTSLVLFSLSLWAFFTSSLSMDAKRLLLLAGMLGLSLVFLYFSNRLWQTWISRVRQAADELAG